MQSRPSMWCRVMSTSFFPASCFPYMCATSPGEEAVSSVKKSAQLANLQVVMDELDKELGHCTCSSM